MPLFFIEMGQGIIGRGDLRVCTSALQSCVLIAGYNAGTRDGGMYHFPSGHRKDPEVRRDMDTWAAILAPTAITLVMATNHGGMFAGEEGTPRKDRITLTNWAFEVCKSAAATLDLAGAGLQLLPAGGYMVGRVTDLAGDFINNRIELHHWSAGTYLDYGRFTLIGRRRVRQ